MKTGANQIISGAPGRASTFKTISLRPIDPLYGPDAVAELDYARDLADPGAFPYTRGIHESGDHDQRRCGNEVPREREPGYRQCRKHLAPDGAISGR
jgi:hypothetical protein